MEIKILGVQSKSLEYNCSASTERKLTTTFIMSNSWKVSSQQATQKWDDDRTWYSQEWKTDTEMYERSGRPDETSWRASRETQPCFTHEETHHDGTAQSVVNEVMPRDRPGRPDVDPQRGAWPQFVIGNDEAELEIVSRINQDHS